MDIQRLKYFLEVTRQKNFSRAAEVCRVSQPSLSQQVKKLEEEVGGSLLVRSRGAVRLSTLGEAFLRHAQAIMAEVQGAEEFINRSQDGMQRTVRLGAIPTIAPYLVPRVFQVVRGSYPGIRFELVESQTELLEGAVLSGEVDFALLSPPTRIDSDCDYLKLVEDEFLLTLPEGHRLAGVDEIRGEDLKNEPMVLLENSHCLARQTEAFCEEIGLCSEVRMRSSQIDTLLGVVEAGFGLTFTPEMAARRQRHRRVVFRSMGQIQCSREVRLVWWPRQFLPKAQKAVLESVREWINCGADSQA